MLYMILYTILYMDVIHYAVHDAIHNATHMLYMKNTWCNVCIIAINLDYIEVFSPTITSHSYL